MCISLIINIRIKPHSSPWFSADCAAAIAHRNHFFFVFTKRINGLHLKWRSERQVIVVKGS